MARWSVRRVVGLTTVLAACAIGLWAMTNALGCGIGERAVFAQFPGYTSPSNPPTKRNTESDRLVG